MIQVRALAEKLDTYFRIGAFDEREDALKPPGYDSLLARFAAPEFMAGPGNGLMLDNAPQINRLYLTVFPNREAIDQVIAREVERGAPGALIFTHHNADYPESLANTPIYIDEAQLAEMKEHAISLYVCHAPLDCHPEISTSGAIAAALGLKVTGQFAPYRGGLCGVYGKPAQASFEELARKCAEAMELPGLRFASVRHNGLPVQKVAIVAGYGGDEEYLREAEALGCDTFITGEWFPFGPSDWRAERRQQMRESLRTLGLNLIGTSHYGSELIVLRDALKEWFKTHVQGLELALLRQKDPWR